MSDYLSVYFCLSTCCKLKYYNSISRKFLFTTRTKTSIRYAKENDREKRERRRERKVEGEI